MGARERMTREEIGMEGKLEELGRDSIGGKELSSEIINIRDRRMLGVRYIQGGNNIRGGLRSGASKETTSCETGNREEKREEIWERWRGKGFKEIYTDGGKIT